MSCYAYALSCLSRLSQTIAKLRALRPIVAAVSSGARTFAEHAIEAVDEQIDGFLAILACDTGDEIATANFNVAFGDKRIEVSFGVLK